MKKLMVATACTALTLAARDVPVWLEKGVVAQVPAAGTANMPALAASGVTIVRMQEASATPAQVAAFTAAAHAAGLKALAPCVCPKTSGEDGLFVITNLVPRWVGSPADGWVVSGADRLPLETWELARQAVKGVKPGLVLVAEGSRLGNQRSAFDADFPPPWNAALNDVLKAHQPVVELERLWRLMRENRPEGSRFLRGSPHWDPVPVAFAFALDGVPVLSAGQEGCCRAVLPQLCALRAAEPAFTEGDLVWLETDAPEKVAAFVRTAPDGRRVVCVFNLRRETVTVKAKLPAALADAPLLAERCAYADGAYVFAGTGYDIRAVDGAGRTSAERTARAAALAAAETPRARDLELKDPIYKDLTNLTARAVPPYLRGAMMYQLFLRPFTPEGTLKAAEARLPFVKSLGTDIIYLCPVATADRGTDPVYWSARQKQSRLGNPCNPYRIADYFGVDPEYGSEQDLKEFVAAAHALGMKVLFDVVYYHCGPNAVFLKDQPEWALRNADGSFQLGEWAFPRLDVKNPAVREYFFENMAWYLREFQCDGFRCDVGGMLPLWYREEAYRRNKAVKDDVVMLCEGADPREQQVAFDLCYAFPMQVAIRDFLAGKGSATNLSVNCVQRESRFPKGYHWMRCFQNHDYANCAPGQKRWEEKYGLALNDALLVTLFTLDGVPMVYNGQEIADTAPHSIWSNRFHGKWGIDWSRAFTPEGGHRLALVRALGRLRHDHPSFFDAPTEFLKTPFPHELYAFRRPLADGTEWLTAVNISGKDLIVTVPAGFHAILAGPGATLDAVTGRLRLPPQSWLLGAKGVPELVRLPRGSQRPEARFNSVQSH
ncbi:MAG TPA: alpha-amylase family glycosyl hydrolase [Kiritimatiellia bacterium]|nr:alpha-amylase family glycosyl hydrolase [Kiritimatiellia bacterium]